MSPSNAPSHTIILTHEHADFDALASLLAAAKLYPQAMPVLPRQLNRNLEAFLAVYRDVLPFVRLEDLPRRRVDHVILVDTQTVQPVRGMGAHATGLIIDHHPLMRDLLPGWSFSGEEVGATTTLLVEQLAERGISLNATEATLLLLGIYEDTGGLSYETTTPRDVRATAWLMERGANLLLVRSFLHHPLTDEQRALYQQLADNSHPYQFSGHAVIIATATVSETVEEISTLAHKLHDLYEPDAIFMLVQMGDYIQLVARSISDAIDVGKIAAALGGGGHSRAAGRADPRKHAGQRARNPGVSAAEPCAPNRDRGADHVLRRAADPRARRHHCRRRGAHAPLRLRGLSRGRGRADRRHADAPRDRPGHAPRPPAACREPLHAPRRGARDAGRFGRDAAPGDDRTGLGPGAGDRSAHRRHAGHRHAHRSAEAVGRRSAGAGRDAGSAHGGDLAGSAPRPDPAGRRAGGRTGLSAVRGRRLRARSVAGAPQPRCRFGGRGRRHPAGAGVGRGVWAATCAATGVSARPSGFCPIRCAPRRTARCPNRSISPPPAPSSTSTRPLCRRWSAAASSRTCTAATSPSTRWRSG